MKNLIAQIKQAQLTARKDKDTLKATVLTTLIGEAEAVGKNKGNRAPTDAEVTAVVKKFLDGANFILDKAVDNLEARLQAREEITILEAYMPKQLSAAELETIVSNLIAVNGVDSPRKLGLLMKDLKAQYDGQYDGAVASRIAKEILEK
jgi:uncharacterized protein YqeY